MFQHTPTKDRAAIIAHHVARFAIYLMEVDPYSTRKGLDFQGPMPDDMFDAVADEGWLQRKSALENVIREKLASHCVVAY